MPDMTGRTWSLRLLKAEISAILTLFGRVWVLLATCSCLETASDSGSGSSQKIDSLGTFR